MGPSADLLVVRPQTTADDGTPARRTLAWERA